MEFRLRETVELRRAKSFGSDDDEVLWHLGTLHGTPTKCGIDVGERDATAKTSLSSILCLDSLDEWARAVQDAVFSWHLSEEELDRVGAVLERAEGEVEYLLR